MYDISAQLPVEAELKSQEFLAGRYTLSFTLDKTDIDLYRFKPAAAILRSRNLREFGNSLAGDAVCVHEVDDRIAVWQETASGLDRLAVLAGRKPGWTWLRIELVEEHNAILAVKGSGRGTMNGKLLEHIAEQFMVTEAV